MKKFAAIFFTTLFAFAILSVSLMRSASVSYSFGTMLEVFAAPTDDSIEEVEIDYVLPYPGRVHPDSVVWYPKALRDKIWMGLTTDSGRQAELNLLFADKRLGSSRVLFERKKPELAISTLSKAEKYLQKASNLESSNRQKGIDTSSFLIKLANSSLKHRQEIENMIPTAPEDARPELIKLQDYSKETYKSARDVLNSKGMPTPMSPFDDQ